MAHVAIIGAGLGGLATASFLSRRGHEVDLLEKDSEPPPADWWSGTLAWRRRGVPQMRQPHNFLGLSRAVLSEEAPDVLDRLAEAGCGQAYMAGFPACDPERQFLSTVASRPTFECVLRELIRKQPLARFHTGAKVSGLRHERGKTPRVTGIVLDEGGEVGADLTIDFSGRFTKAGKWLSAIGARPWREETQRTPFVYLTRWYALKSGRDFPSDKTAVRQELCYGSAFAFPADNRRFSLTLLLSLDDPLRGAVMNPEKFDTVMKALPLLGDWLDAGVPLNKPEAMSGIDNRLRRLADAQGPVVSGFVAAGDAAMHTNPTLGRGASLAFLQGQMIAGSADMAASDPGAFSQASDDWVKAKFAPWYASQVEADGDRIVQMETAISGEAASFAPRPPEYFDALLSLAAADIETERILNRNVHLLDGPAALKAPALVARVERHRTEMPHQSIQPPLGRAEFAGLLA